MFQQTMEQKSNQINRKIRKRHWTIAGNIIVSCNQSFIYMKARAWILHPIKQSLFTFMHHAKMWKFWQDYWQWLSQTYRELYKYTALKPLNWSWIITFETLDSLSHGTKILISYQDKWFYSFDNKIYLWPLMRLITSTTLAPISLKQTALLRVLVQEIEPLPLTPWVTVLSKLPLLLLLIVPTSYWLK